MKALFVAAVLLSTFGTSPFARAECQTAAELAPYKVPSLTDADFYLTREQVQTNKRLLQAKHGEIVLVDMTANWCAPCQEMKKTQVLEQISCHAKGKVKIFRVEITADDTKTVSNFFPIPNVPAVLIFVDGIPLMEKDELLMVDGFGDPATYVKNFNDALEQLLVEYEKLKQEKEKAKPTESAPTETKPEVKPETKPAVKPAARPVPNKRKRS